MVLFRLIPAFVLGAIVLPANAQWNPAAGQWAKAESSDVRVMTFNLKDGLCSSNAKVEQRNNWTAIARIVAAMQPDILLLQETGDNTGNGSGSGVDSVLNLERTVDLFLHGGTDPFRGGTVSSWVQKYAPAYDLPHVFVSTINDGFNRNIILSRFPFSDLNGDTHSTLSDFILFPDLYSTGGNGGIRGFAFAEIDLPDATYAGDLVVGNAHLKAGGSSSDHAQRIKATQNTAYYVDYLFNGAGTGTPDPRNRIRDNPEVQNILDENTPVILGGDWNEDEQRNGTKGPAEWLTMAERAAGTDGTDKDRSDSTYDDAREFFTNSRTTLGSSKLDYISWQDSITSIRHATIFDSSDIPAGAYPFEIEGYAGGPATVSAFASDHLPVIVDFILPSGGCPADCDASGDVNTLDFLCFLNMFAAGDPGADFNGDGTVDTLDFLAFLNAFSQGC